jgi:ligand-binding sensor domain-containing protein
MAVVALGVLLGGCTCSFALNPSLDISQYGHTGWTIRDGLSLGNIYAITQAPDGYLWLGAEFGMGPFDGIRSVLWRPPAGQHLPNRNVYRLLAARDGTLWIGTFAGFTTLREGKLVPPAGLAGQFVTSLFEARDETVWVGMAANANAGDSRPRLRHAKRQRTVLRRSFGQ